MLISGYLRTVFSRTPIQFWGTPLPVWGVVDVTLAEFFGTIHGVVAFVLAGSIFVHVCIGALNIFKHPGIAARLPPLEKEESQDLVLDGRRSVMASKIARSLAKKLRLFGWIGFRLQFVLAFISALLLAFAITGRAFSPWLSMVWRCYLLGWLRIFAFVFCGLVGLLLHASRLKSRFKTGFLF